MAGRGLGRPASPPVRAQGAIAAFPLGGEAPLPLAACGGQGRRGEGTPGAPRRWAGAVAVTRGLR